MMRKLLLADLLCGAGGSSTGGTRSFDPLGVAWAAGIIEGEGCILSALRSQPASQSQGKYIAIRVRVVMTDRDVVERLRDIFGIGRVFPYRNTQGLGTKQLFRWDASSRKDVTAVCDAIYPWMGVRRRAQINRLRALLEAYPPVSGSERARRTWLTRHANAAGATA